MAITAADAESRKETGLETGCTSNLTTTASARKSLHRRESRYAVPLARAFGRLKLPDGRPDTASPSSHDARRAVTYGGLSCLLAAWLASAASTTLQPFDSEPRSRRVARRDVDGCARDRSAGAGGAASSAPRSPRQRRSATSRNPFAFQRAGRSQAVQPRRAARNALRRSSRCRRQSRCCR